MLEIKNILKKEDGNATSIVICIIVVVIMIFFCICAEYLRLALITKGIRDAFEKSLIAVATENYDETYPCLREGYGAAYQLNKTDEWKENVDRGEVENKLKEALKLTEEEGHYIKYNDSNVEYTLSDLKVEVTNRQLAPNNSSKVKKYEVRGSVILKIPPSFGFTRAETTKINLDSVSGYTPLF
ncbi:hypothetical protein KW95_04335 [Clostridioides difficile]|nr:hypothetical protein KW95_04335 [Clostridioides difficile]